MALYISDIAIDDVDFDSFDFVCDIECSDNENIWIQIKGKQGYDAQHHSDAWCAGWELELNSNQELSIIRGDDIDASEIKTLIDDEFCKNEVFKKFENEFFEYMQA